MHEILIGVGVNIFLFSIVLNSTFFSDQDAANKLGAVKSSHDHNDYDYDPSYAFVEFHNRLVIFCYATACLYEFNLYFDKFCRRC